VHFLEIDALTGALTGAVAERLEQCKRLARCAAHFASRAT